VLVSSKLTISSACDVFIIDLERPSYQNAFVILKVAFVILIASNFSCVVNQNTS